jgi:hypothetical protein
MHHCLNLFWMDSLKQGLQNVDLAIIEARQSQDTLLKVLDRLEADLDAINITPAPDMARIANAKKRLAVLHRRLKALE